MLVQVHLVVVMLQLHVESLLVLTLVVHLLVLVLIGVGDAAGRTARLAHAPVECQPQVAPL